MITLLDGGMGRELIRRGAGDATGLWSARALLEAPQVVVDVHRDYIAAGAGIITTNSYSTVPSYLAKAGLESRAQELTGLAGRLARQAVEGRDVLVAGSLPPLSESYRPDLVPDAATGAPVYAAMAAALAPHVDVFLCETMSSAAEARSAVTAAAATGRPVFVSWTLDDRPGRGLRSGESVAEALAALDGLPLAGCLFNCTHPEAISAALPELRALTELPVGGYPNRLNAVARDWTLDNGVSTGLRSDLEVAQFVEFAERWIDAGATIIGGCCGIGPEYIAALAARLAD